MAALLIHHCDKFGCLPVTVQHQPLINRHICPPKTVHLLRSLIAVAAANWENHQESVQFKGQIISVNKCESKLSHGPCLGKARYEETNAVIMLICRVVPMHKVGFTRAQPTFTCTTGLRGKIISSDTSVKHSPIQNTWQPESMASTTGCSSR
eukprot:1152015-Pelagomonas_calceolata.AAC.13